ILVFTTGYLMASHTSGEEEHNSQEASTIENNTNELPDTDMIPREHAETIMDERDEFKDSYKESKEEIKDLKAKLEKKSDKIDNLKNEVNQTDNNSDKIQELKSEKQKIKQDRDNQ